MVTAPGSGTRPAIYFLSCAMAKLNDPNPTRASGPWPQTESANRTEQIVGRGHCTIAGWSGSTAPHPGYDGLVVAPKRGQGSDQVKFCFAPRRGLVHQVARNQTNETGLS